MGKIAEEEQKDYLEAKNVEDFSFPMKIPDEIIIQKQFSGKFIAIHKGMIIAVDNSLKNLYKKCGELLPKGEGCLFDYIEESVGIYGFNF